MTGRAAFLTLLWLVMELALIIEALCALRSVIASQTTADAITHVYNICAQRLSCSESGRRFRPTGSNGLNMVEIAPRERNWKCRSWRSIYFCLCFSIPASKTAQQLRSV